MDRKSIEKYTKTAVPVMAVIALASALIFKRSLISDIMFLLFLIVIFVNSLLQKDTTYKTVSIFTVIVIGFLYFLK